MQTITPFLWFDGNAEEAVNFYLSVFENAKITEIVRTGKAGPGPDGSVLTIAFELNGREFTALNGGPHFQFTPAISFYIGCDTQDEVDRLWDRLLEGGGKPMQCGWLTDRYGLSWQVVPKILIALLKDKDRQKSARAMQAMMKMVKLDIGGLQRAYDGEAA